MIRRENELGSIAVGNNVFTKIAGNAATNCFGVKGMAIRSVKDGLVHLLRLESMGKGVHVETNEELHIMVDRGVNLSAVGDSIISEVRYMVCKQTDIQVRDVTIYVDSMVID